MTSERSKRRDFLSLIFIAKSISKKLLINILLFPGKKIMFEHIVGDYCLKFIHYKFKYNLKNQHLPYLWTGSSGKEYRNYKMIFFFNCGVKSNGA